MSAAQLLEQVKSLPSEERAAFVREFRQWEIRENGPSKPSQSFVMPDYAGRLRKIFGDAVLAENIVLAAREEERW